MSTNPPHKSLLTGTVRKYHSNFYYVEAEGVLYECMLRALIKKEGSEVLVGDHVELDSIDAVSKTGRIAKVLPRKNSITRPKVANVDQALVVYSLKTPDFDFTQADRYLTHIELAGITPILCISKTDLAQSNAEREAITSLYQDQLGYTVFLSSVRQPDSLQPVREQIKHRITVLAGPSGSGKSSLINALNPGLQLRVGDVSEKIGRGQHTTRHVELMMPDETDPETFIADTPGFSNLRFNTVMPVQIAQTFRDFKPWQGQCTFSDCLHLDEEGCAILANLDSISSTRYASYKDIMSEALQYKTEANASSQKEEFGYKKLDRKGKESLQILRLKEKSRDDSRRKVKQQFSQVNQFTERDEEDTEGDALESDDFSL